MEELAWVLSIGFVTFVVGWRFGGRLERERADAIQRTAEQDLYRWNEQYTGLQTEIATLKETEASIKEKLEEAVGYGDSLQEELSRRKEMIVNLKKGLEKMDSEVQQRALETTTHQKELDEYEEKTMRLEQELEALRRQHAEQERQIAALEAGHRELEPLRGQLDRRTEELHALEEQLSELQGVAAGGADKERLLDEQRRAVESLKAKVEELREQSAQLEEEKEQLARERDEGLRDLAEEAASREEVIERQQDELVSLQGQLEALKSATSRYQEETGKLSETAARRIEELREKEEMIQSFRAQLLELTQGAGPDEDEGTAVDVEQVAAEPEEDEREEDREDEEHPGTQLELPTGESDGEEPRDDLKRLFGLGAVIEERLNRMGIFTYRQIAEIHDDDLSDLKEELGRLKHLIERHEWIPHARRLHEEKYGEVLVP